MPGRCRQRPFFMLFPSCPLFTGEALILLIPFYIFPLLHKHLNKESCRTGKPAKHGLTEIPALVLLGGNRF